MKTVCLLLGAVAYVHGASVPIVVPSGDPLVATDGVQDFAWGYEDQQLTGIKKPADWKDINTACDGSQSTSQQSPIDIVTADAVTPTTDVGALTTTMFDKDITGALANTGRVLRWFAVWGTAKPTISGGPLTSGKTYGLSHIDFHWGSDSTKGSEHTMDGVQDPMEMQMVFFDSDFPDHTEALNSGNPDALATISQLFEIDATTNDGLTPIETQIPSIVAATAMKRRKREARQGRQATKDVKDELSANNNNLVEKVTINIEQIIGMSTIENYYYYDGSMTEPDCKENTKWIINKDMAKVTETFLNALRTMMTSSDAGNNPESMADNFRPVQDLNGRTVNLRVPPALPAIVVPAVDTAGDLVGTGAVQDFAWGYDSQSLLDILKPDDWENLSTDAAVCGSGTSQSPIDIVTADAKTPTTDPGALTTTMFDTDITGALANTGRVLRWFAVWGLGKPTISGGPLGTKVYGLSHIDFHFGSDNTKGSEHEMDGDQSPMEMQMVFFRSDFADQAAALASSDADALATISQLFEIDTTTNDGLTPIKDKISDIVHATALKRRKREARQGRQANTMVTEDLSDAKDNLVEQVTINIEKIIGMSTIENYYYYDGSMTEPDCKENTKWIINKDMAKVTEAYLTEIRKLETTSLATGVDKLQDNFRPVQKLNSRTVNLRVSPAASLLTETQLQVLGGTVAGIAVFNALNGVLGQPEVAKNLVENPLTEFISNIDLNDLNPFDDASVVQQRSSEEVTPQQVYAPAYPQPVYQGQGYQQYVAPPVLAQ